MIQPIKMGMLLLAIGGAFWIGKCRGVGEADQLREINAWNRMAFYGWTDHSRHLAADKQDCRAALSVMSAIHMSMQEYDSPNEKPTEVCKVRFNRADGTPVTYSMPPAWKHNQRRFDSDAKCSW